jgi:hypothetical protein
VLGVSDNFVAGFVNLGRRPTTEELSEASRLLRTAPNDKMVFLKGDRSTDLQDIP